MASKKKREADSALPLNVETESMEPSSSITYASDVIAIIAGLAASEVEGIAGMSNVNSGLLGKNRNITRGIKVEVGSEEVSVDLYVTVEYGMPIQRAARDAQESVKKSIESMTGLHVVRVDVHVQGVSFEKENNALQAGAGKAKLESGDAEASASKAAAAPHKADMKLTEEKADDPAQKEMASGTATAEDSTVRTAGDGVSANPEEIPAESDEESAETTPGEVANSLGEDEEIADRAFAAEDDNY